MTYFLAKVNELQETIDRVLELHEEVDSSDCMDPNCCPSQDRRTFCSECNVVYPCDTRKLLTGKPIGHKLEHSDQVLRFTHGPEVCQGEACTIHNMSDHHMREYPQLWRGDRALMERVCPHGVGHPDPDDPKTGTFEAVHGCDGCCQ